MARKQTGMKRQRRHILEPYTVNGHIVRYSVRLRSWIVDELAYFVSKQAAFHFAQTGERTEWSA
jgi:hypothetical protein